MAPRHEVNFRFRRTVPGSKLIQLLESVGKIVKLTMAEKLSSDVEIVSKLKRRLHDAAYQQKQVSSTRPSITVF